jgi:hypothetical protein
LRKILDRVKRFVSNAIGRVARFLATHKAVEPARLTERIRALLVLLVGAGWFTIDDATINLVASGGAMVVSWLLSRFVRSTVTPVAKLDGCTACQEHDPDAAA